MPRPIRRSPVPFRARIGGPDQGKAGRGDDRCGRSLHDAGSDQPGGRRRQRASRGRQTEQDATEPEHARFAINIRERAADQCQGGERQQIPVENPLNGGEVRTEISAQSGNATGSAVPSMNAIDDASTQAASTMRRRRGGAFRPNSRGQGSASITPRLQGSTNGCASWRQARRLRFAGVVICGLVLGCRCF